METEFTLQRRSARWITIAALLWLSLPLMIANIFYCDFILPKSVEGWRSQGIRELPALWQFAVDISFWSDRFWYIIFPLLFLCAIIATSVAIAMTVRRNRAQHSSY